MWHASVSLQNRRGKLDDQAVVEAAAVGALAGVGSTEGEWWQWGASRVGHLRVPVTDEEFELVPPGSVVDDAGDEGEWRERSRTGADSC